MKTQHNMSWTTAAQCNDVLGESPVYLPDEEVLAWVDIGRALWHRLDLKTSQVETHTFETALTGFSPVQEGGFIGAFADGIAYFDAAGHRGPWLHQPELGRSDNRFNDAGTDPHGRFIAGSMNMAGQGEAGALYQIKSSGTLTRIKSGIGIANTIAFSPDGTTFYTADTAKGELAAYHYDPETGEMGGKVSSFNPSSALPGAPDGSTVDAEGYIWNARWGGSCIVRLAPDGSTDRLIPLPVRNPTSCTFVGDSLFVTTSTWDFTDEDFAAEPLAGALLCLDVGVRGLHRPKFGETTL